MSILKYLIGPIIMMIPILYLVYINLQSDKKELYFYENKLNVEIIEVEREYHGKFLRYYYAEGLFLRSYSILDTLLVGDSIYKETCTGDFKRIRDGVVIDLTYDYIGFLEPKCE